jgi:hypothetical protein
MCAAGISLASFVFHRAEQKPEPVAFLGWV